MTELIALLAVAVSSSLLVAWWCRCAVRDIDRAFGVEPEEKRRKV